MEELEIGKEPYFSNVNHTGTPLFFSSHHTSCSFFLLHQCSSSSWQLNVGVSTLEMSPRVSFPSTLIPSVMTLNIIYSLMISKCIYHKLDFSCEPQPHVQPPIQHFHLGVWLHLTVNMSNTQSPYFLLPIPAYSPAFSDSLNNSIFPLAQAKNLRLP